MKFVFDNKKEMDRFIEKLSYLIFCPGDFDLPLGVPICDPDTSCLECWQNAFSHVDYEIVGEASPKHTVNPESTIQAGSAVDPELQIRESTTAECEPPAR